MKLLLILLFCCLIVMSANAKVLELNERFGDVHRKGNWLVMFYAPWCGHCKHLEPIWLEVGQQVANDGQDIAVARLDATKFSSLTTEYGVRGFPTIKFLKSGKQFDYNGPRTKEAIVSFAYRAKGPEVIPMAASSLQQIRSEKPVFFLYVGDQSHELGKAYADTASDMFTSIDFYSCEKTSLPKGITVKSDPAVLVFKDKRYYEVPDETARPGVLDIWVKLEQFPSYNHLTGTSYHTMNSIGRRFVISVVGDNKQFNKTMEVIALKRSLPYTFCWIEDSKIANSLTYSTISSPNLLIYDGRTREFFAFHDPDREAQELNVRNVMQFFARIDSGLISPKGGNGAWQQIRRTVGDMLSSLIGMFTETPIIASLVIVLPTVLICGMCFCLCTISEGDSAEDYRSSEDEDEEDLPPYNEGDLEGNDPGFNDLAEQDEEEFNDLAEVPGGDPMQQGEGVRKRVREEDDRDVIE